MPGSLFRGARYSGRAGYGRSVHDPRFMKMDPKVRLVVLEVGIGRKDGKTATVGHGADEQVDRRPRDAVRPAGIEETRRLVVIARDDLDVTEIAEPLLDIPERIS